MGLFWKVITLGPLYKGDNFKDRVQWMILIVFKLLLPVCIVLVSDGDEGASYRFAARDFYKENMLHPCGEREFGTNISFRREETREFPAAEKRFLDRAPRDGANISAMLEELMKKENIWQKIRDRNGRKKSVPKKCCDVYRALIERNANCLSEQGSSTSKSSFTIAMFYPLFATIACAIVMSPFKASATLRDKLVREGRPGVRLTEEEMISRIQNCVQFVTDMVGYFLVMHSVATRMLALKKCQGHLAQCSPGYQSFQVMFLVAFSQTTWFSFLWTFIFT